MGIDPSELPGILARLRRARGETELAAPFDAVEREAELHDAILQECRRRGWYVVHARMDAPTTVSLGCPDFIIAADNGVAWWIEAKSRQGKATLAQQAIAAWLRKLGHRYALVRSISEFLKAVQP